MDFCDFERGGNSIQRVQHDKTAHSVRIRIEECKRDVDKYVESLERDLVDRIEHGRFRRQPRNADVLRTQTNPNGIRNHGSNINGSSVTSGGLYMGYALTYLVSSMFNFHHGDQITTVATLVACYASPLCGSDLTTKHVDGTSHVFILQENHQKQHSNALTATYFSSLV